MHILRKIPILPTFASTLTSSSDPCKVTESERFLQSMADMKNTRYLQTVTHHNLTMIGARDSSSAHDRPVLTGGLSDAAIATHRDETRTHR